MSFKEQFNFNSVITLGIAFINILMFIVGTFLWSSITKLQDELRQLNTQMATAVSNQNSMQKVLEQATPKGELELKLELLKARILIIENDMVRLKKTP